jgi:hypothetical protein
MEDKLRKKLLVVKNSEAEAKVIEELAQRANTNESNVVRRLIKAAAEAEGINVTGLFDDGKPGNWLPKPRGKDLPVTTASPTGRHNTTTGVSAPVVGI